MISTTAEAVSRDLAPLVDPMQECREQSPWASMMRWEEAGMAGEVTAAEERARFIVVSTPVDNDQESGPEKLRSFYG